MIVRVCLESRLNDTERYLRANPELHDEYIEAFLQHFPMHAWDWIQQCMDRGWGADTYVSVIDDNGEEYILRDGKLCRLSESKSDA
jgi:hypothetical protein